VSVRAAQEVAPGVHVMASRRYDTTSTVITSGPDALVIDPAWDADELAGIHPLIRHLGAQCVAGLATHLHYDHVLWHHDLGDVPRWSSEWAAVQWQHSRSDLIQPLIGDIPDDLVALAGRITPVAEMSLPLGDRQITLHQHDAHARGHLALEIADAGVLLAGDMLSDVELPYPDADELDLSLYLDGLDRLAPVIARCHVLVPGHGTPSYAPMDRLDADRRYLDAVLSGDDTDDPRLAHEGMREIHQRTVEQARVTREGGQGHRRQSVT
jgi:glyoxylase-like metal-dependent hydrolase (beta-lactamase superfamily II)